MSPGHKQSYRFAQLAATPWFNFSILILLWLFACFWNFGKAFHIDDTGHLEIARWIAANPLHPMSGVLSWGKDFQPIYETNQPHLYFYLMAVWGSLFGWTETSMHFLMSLFVFWAIFAFYRIANFLSPGSAIIPTALFAISPAFVVGQNSMVDMPLMAVWIEFFWALLDPNRSERNRYLSGALLCSVALLIKYTSLVLLPVLLFHMIIRKRYKQLVWGLLPVIFLVIWSVFNLYDYGGIHIIGREIGNRTQSLLHFATSWLGILGAITPFALLAFIAMSYRSTSVIAKLSWLLLSIFNLLAYSFILWLVMASPSNDSINDVLKWSFLINGSALIVAIVTITASAAIKSELNIAQLTLLYWFVSSAIFIIGFAPFMATRHVLLSVPPLVLLLYFWVIERTKARNFVAAVIVLSLMLTSLLAMADRWYAEVYRRQASSIANSLPKQATIWFNGNWGWQWYASQSGMKQFSLIEGRQKPGVGDFIVATPRNVCCALPIPNAIKLEQYQRNVIPRDSRIAHFASSKFYRSGPQPWGYYLTPLEEFVVWRVIEVQGY